MEKAELYRINKGKGNYGYYHSFSSYRKYFNEFTKFYEAKCRGCRAAGLDIRILHKPTGAKLAIHDGEIVWEEL